MSTEARLARLERELEQLRADLRTGTDFGVVRQGSVEVVIGPYTVTGVLSVDGTLVVGDLPTGGAVAASGTSVLALGKAIPL